MVVRISILPIAFCLAACSSSGSRANGATCESNCTAICPGIASSCGAVCAAATPADQACIANSATCDQASSCGGTVADMGTSPTDMGTTDMRVTLIQCHAPGTSCTTSSQCRDFVCNCADSSTQVVRVTCNSGTCPEAAAYESVCASSCGGSATVSNNPDTACMD